MPDITMCSSEICPKRKSCYRHEAKPSEWQSYADFYFYEGDDCEGYEEIEEGKKIYGK